MLRVIAHKSAAAAQKYYTDGLKKEDYYSEKQEIIGKWEGRAAARLGLAGEVTKDAFAALVENRHPVTGERLTARTNVDRRVGYDLNFHAPKSLSLVHALNGDQRILDAFRSAVSETMSDLEKAAATRVRRGKSDTERTTGNLAWAEFIHLTARPVGGVPDPHLHIHCFAFNATFDEVEKRWKAASWADIKKDASYYEAAFHARLTDKLSSMGYGIQRTPKGWELAGILRSIIDRFSRRGTEINQLAADKGITDAKAKDALGATSRKGKRHGLKYAELLADWKGRLTAEERKLIAQIGRGKSPVERAAKITASQAMNEAVEKLFAKESVVEVKRLVAETLRFGVGHLTPEAAWRELGRRKIIVREMGKETFCTTREVLAEELALINFVRTGRNQLAPIKRGRVDLGSLADDQRAAARHLLTSNDQVMVVRGGAGVGKTTLMIEAVRQIEKTGLQVFAFAPSAEASRGTQREAGFANAETVAHLLANPKLQRAVKGQVIWIDEAGLLGIRDMWRVMQIAGHDTRIILTGDIAQHRPVARGDTLSLIQRYAGLKIAHVYKIRRQKVEEYREAVAALSQGDLKTGFQRLDELGAIIEVADDAARYRMLAERFLELSRKDAVPLVVSPTHREGAVVTDAIREAKREAGLLGKERTLFRYHNLAWEEPDRRRAENYAVGLLVQFNQNAPGIIRGSLFTVTGHDEKNQVMLTDRAGKKLTLPLMQASKFDVFERRETALAAGDRIRITRNGPSADGKRLNNGSVFTVAKFNRKGQMVLDNGSVLNPDHGHWRYGYVETSYSSQGKTTKDVLVAQSADSALASSKEGFYVTVSRGQESVRIFTDDRQALQKAVGNTSLRVAGIDFAGLTPAETILPMSQEQGGATWQNKVGKPDNRKWTEKLNSRLSQTGASQHVNNLLAQRGTTGKANSLQRYLADRNQQAAQSGKGRSKGTPNFAKPKRATAHGIGGYRPTELRTETKEKMASKAASLPTPETKTQKQGRIATKVVAARERFRQYAAKFKKPGESAKATKLPRTSLQNSVKAAKAAKPPAAKKAPAPKVTPPPPAPRPRR